jgi:hypothetical protein
MQPPLAAAQTSPFQCESSFGFFKAGVWSLKIIAIADWVAGMKKGVATTLILGIMVVLLCGTNVITIGLFVWQRLQNQKLRQQLATRPETVREPVVVAPISATTVCNAARDGDLPRLIELLDSHPELLNAPAGPGHATPLHHAVYFCRPAIVEELVRRKANVNALNGNKASPLHDCASKGTMEMAVLLLEHGADVTIRNHKGQTPLAMCIERDRPEIAEVLRKYGAKE